MRNTTPCCSGLFRGGLVWQAGWTENKRFLAFFFLHAFFLSTYLHPRGTVFTFLYLLSPHEMKEEIETKHFLGTNRAAEPLLTKTGRGVCVSPQPLPWVLSCGECYVSIFCLLVVLRYKSRTINSRFFFFFFFLFFSRTALAFSIIFCWSPLRASFPFAHPKGLIPYPRPGYSRARKKHRGGQKKI